MYAVQVEPLTLEASSTDSLMVLSALFAMPNVGSVPVSVTVPVGAVAADIDAAFRDGAVAKAADYGLTLPRANIVTVGLMT